MREGGRGDEEPANDVMENDESMSSAKANTCQS